MMRESVSHLDLPAVQTTPPATNRPPHRLQWGVLICVGTLTILMGIVVLMALMSPENLKTAPTIALICVLVLLCVPVPVLMLERSHRKAAQRIAVATQQHAPTAQPAHAQRQSVIHTPHIPHNSHTDTHRTPRTSQERQTAQTHS